jgi:8-oxo-dGTP diphosphatase
MKFNIAVKGIIQKGGKILVLKRSDRDEHKPGIWETPGGGIDEKINPKEALEKEILEETNLVVKIKEPFNVFSFTKDTGEYKVGITFLCDYASGDLKLSNEHEEFKWIKPGKFKNLNSIKSLYDEIENYAKKYEK